MLDFEFLTTVVYHLRFELLFTSLFALILLFSPEAWAKLGPQPKPKKQEKKAEAPRDPKELAAFLTDLASTRYGRAMDLFAQKKEELLTLGFAEFVQVVSALAVASVRVGRSDRLPALFQALQGQDQQVAGSVLVHVMRVLASRQQYSDALQAWESWQLDVSADLQHLPSLAASCLVQCSVELRRPDTAEQFFRLLQERKAATGRDYSAMIRLHASQQGAQQAKQLLVDMQKDGIVADNVVYNMVLAACADSHQSAEVKSLLAQMPDADIVTYNTRLKGCVKTKDVDRAFAIYKELEASPHAPTQVTFGTLLEVCTRSGDLVRAREVLAKMTAADVPKNNIVYTSMIRGLAAAGELTEAMSLFQEMRQDNNVRPDVISYSVLIKGHCDVGRLEPALALLEQLLQDGHTPDEILFNNLLAGCAQKPHVQLGEKLLSDMVAHEIQPTMATFSILLKMYSKAGAVQQSAALLEQMPTKYGVVPAPRLYVQHISWCIRLRKGASAIQVFKMLLERCSDSKETQCDSFLTSCASFNMLDTGCALLEIDATRFSLRTIREFKDVLEKKKKPQLALRVEASLRLAERRA